MCSATYFTLWGTVFGAGCDRVIGGWVNNLGTGDDEWTKSCDVPSGELTSSNGWADFSPYGNLPTVHKWLQILSGSVDFGGEDARRSVESSDSHPREA
ncbi:MAG: hypothetical protein ACOYX1_03040 [Acidobacteriota bacterium]